jgi:ubiquitin-like-conjugating enzyme ATG10
MTTLYEYLVPPHFKAQTENVGVIGGITITVRCFARVRDI